MNQLFENCQALKAVFDQTAYVDTRSLTFLHCLVKEIQPKVVLELGTGKGCSTAFMALAIGDGRIVTIDNYEREDINSEQLVVDNLISCSIYDKVQLVIGNTLEPYDLLLEDADKPEIVFMDSSHIAVNLRKEYEILQSILPERHIIIVDDAFGNDALDFVKELDYPFFVGLPYHQGMAILGTHLECMEDIKEAVDDCIILTRER